LLLSTQTQAANTLNYTPLFIYPLFICYLNLLQAEVLVFGSYETGLYTPASDTDIVVCGAGLNDPTKGDYRRGWR
jgi:hypothetical protein